MNESLRDERGTAPRSVLHTSTSHKGHDLLAPLQQLVKLNVAFGIPKLIRLQGLLKEIIIQTLGLQCFRQSLKVTNVMGVGSLLTSGEISARLPLAIEIVSGGILSRVSFYLSPGARLGL